MVNFFKDLYLYRELLKNNIKKEIRGKYKGAWLGIVWTFLNPLFMLVIYSIVFPLILKNQIENYTMFMMIGLLPWNFFTSAIQMGSWSIISNSSIVKKVYFPREIIPLSVVTSALVNFFFTVIIMFLFIIFSGLGFSWTIVFFPIIVLIQYIFIMGITFALSSLTVFAKDLEHFVSIGLMALFYMTPIIYDSSSLPSKFQFVLKLNPMAGIIQAYRDVLYYKTMPNILNLVVVSIIAIIVMIIGLKLFKKLERNFVEEL